MGLFSKKSKSSSASSGESRKDSGSLQDIASKSSQSSLKSPMTPGFSKMTFPPTIPKVNLPKSPDPLVDPAGYLRSIGSVRERSSIIAGKAKKNELNHFDVHMDQFENCTKFVVSIIKVRVQQ